MSALCAFLGHAYDWSGLWATGSAMYGIKPSTREKATLLIVSCLKKQRCDRADAAKIRGLLTWCDTGLMGRPCRGAMCALTGRQYGPAAKDTHLIASLRKALLFFLLVLTEVPDRAIPDGQFSGGLLLECRGHGSLRPRSHRPRRT